MMQELRHFGAQSGWDALQYLGEHTPPQPLDVLYLAHDPLECAELHPKALAAQKVAEYASMLSAAWLHHNPEMMDIYWESTGIVHALGGLPIPTPTPHSAHPAAEWVGQCSGNYRWLAHVVICLLHAQDIPTDLALLGVLHTTPPSMPSDDLCEPPAFVKPSNIVHDEDGYIDAVASYRKQYG